jgi:DNA-binding CsgD family transcriptional regulator
MFDIDISKCQELNFSQHLMAERLQRARLVLGDKIIKRILCYSLFILGVHRNKIADILQLPENTVRSMLKTIHKAGLPGFTDRRETTTKIEAIPVYQTDVKKDLQVYGQDENYHISINGCDIKVKKRNTMQFKVLLLSLTENGLLTKVQVGELLKISSPHVGYLCKKVSEGDILTLMDKRQGQQKDYVFTPEIKSELILQFAANAATGKSTSSSVLAGGLKQRTSLQLSHRSIRYHIAGLGLKGKSEALQKLIGFKKNSTS